MKRLSFALISGLFLLVLGHIRLGTEGVVPAQTGAMRRVKIIAFVDVTEANTRRFFQTTYKMIKQTYGDRVEFVLRHAPRPDSGGQIVAEALYCAADQFRQWDFLDAVTAGNYRADKPSLSALAAQMGLKANIFSECLEQGKKRPFVESDMREAQRVVRGTPTFFVQGEYVEGAQGFGVFRNIIDRELQMNRPPVKVQIIYDSQFKLEDPHRYFAYLNTYMFPGSELSLISHRAPEGQKLMKEVGARALPTVLFSRDIEQTSPFSYFQNEVEKRGNRYRLKPDAYSGIVEYMETPAVGNNPIKGSAKAPVTIMEFSDFECPACQEFTRNTLPKLIEKYIKPGHVRMVFRNYPLTRMHPHAEGAAIAGECAHRAGIFWKYHDKLFESGSGLDKPNLVKYAESLGQNGKTFSDCLGSSEARNEVQKDVGDGNKFGVRSTPTLLINNYRVSGTDTASVYGVIDYLLKKPGNHARVQTGSK